MTETSARDRTERPQWRPGMGLPSASRARQPDTRDGAHPADTRHVRRSVVRWSVLVAAAGISLLALELLRDGIVVALGATDPVATMLAAVALLGAASIAMTTDRHAEVGLLLALTAAAWTAPLVEGDARLVDPVRSAAAVLAVFLVPLLSTVVIRSGVGAFSRSAVRRMTAVNICAAGLLVGATALVRDPLLDPDCWRNCSANSFLLVSLPTAARVLEAVFIAYAFVAAAVAGWIAVHIARAASRTGSADGSVVVAATAAPATIAAAVLLAVEASGAPSDPSAPAYRIPFLATAVLLVLLGAAAAIAAARERRRIATIARFSDDLRQTPRPGRLEADLRRVLGDPRLRVLFPTSEPWRFINTDGNAVPPPHPGSSTTELRRSHETIAVLEHGIRPATDGGLERQIGACARIAVDNERIRALILAELEALRESRARIVETGDAARRAIERDLHDRAQQSLVAALFELGLVRARAAERGDVELESRAREVMTRVDGIIAQLRELAHGTFPAVLDDVGLEAAVEHLAESSDVPLEVQADLSDRVPRAVERAVYAVVRRAVECADASVGAVEVGIERTGDGVRLRVHPAPRCDLTGARDRVGAVGGSMVVSEDRVEVVIPCG
jgi:signal transduction histidine kinase